MTPPPMMMMMIMMMSLCRGFSSSAPSIRSLTSCWDDLLKPFLLLAVSVPSLLAAYKRNIHGSSGAKCRSCWCWKGHWTEPGFIHHNYSITRTRVQVFTKHLQHTSTDSLRLHFQHTLSSKNYFDGTPFLGSRGLRAFSRGNLVLVELEPVTFWCHDYWAIVDLSTSTKCLLLPALILQYKILFGTFKLMSWSSYLFIFYIFINTESLFYRVNVVPAIVTHFNFRLLIRFRNSAA